MQNLLAIFLAPANALAWLGGVFTACGCGAIAPVPALLDSHFGTAIEGPDKPWLRNRLVRLASQGATSVFTQPQPIAEV